LQHQLSTNAAMDDNPYRPPDTGPDLTVISAAGNRVPGISLLAALQVFIAFTGTGLAFWEIETILGSGPLLAIAGSLHAIAGHRRGRLSAILMGYSAPVFCLAIFVLINLKEWGPGAAQDPVSALAVGYLIPLVIAWLTSELHRSRLRDESVVPA
jgi:hypothetical protein